jgi:Raf kinase inhibitor-like YbhB/YbcL family protein
MATVTVTKTLVVKSPNFKNNDYIPSKYGCDGSNINPAINIENLPNNTQSMALTIDDPDAPNGTFDHWVMWDIPPRNKIEEGSAPGTQGLNSMKENKYTGPCPPSGTHHYHFRIYALDTKLNLPQNTDKKSLLKAIESHIIASGEMIGLFKR